MRSSNEENGVKNMKQQKAADENDNEENGACVAYRYRWRNGDDAEESMTLVNIGGAENGENGW